VVLLDKRLSDDLKREGLARDVVRFVQVARKEAGLELEDRIVLSLQTEADELRAAIDACGDYIAGETLATEMPSDPLDAPAGASEVRIAGHSLGIQLRKA